MDLLAELGLRPEHVRVKISHRQTARDILAKLGVPPEQMTAAFDLPPDQKAIINVGSVGQPRDGDNRACYALVEGNRITYRRVPYSYRTTMSKMDRVGPISEEASDRLEYGR